jgi:hypothetical protein
MKDDIQPDAYERMAELRGGAIIPETRLYCKIRWLAGSSYSDITMHAGMNLQGFLLQNRVSDDQGHRNKQTQGIADQVSSNRKKAMRDSGLRAALSPLVSPPPRCHQQLRWCRRWVLAGLIIETNSQVANVRSFFSWCHYKCSGLKIQAPCDHHCHVHCCCRTMRHGDSYAIDERRLGRRRSDHHESSIAFENVRCYCTNRIVFR